MTTLPLAPSQRYIIIASTIVLAVSFYVWQSKRAVNSENQSQLLRGQLIEVTKEAVLAKILAEKSDQKAAELALLESAASQKALAEHAKSEALKKKLASLVGPVPSLPAIPSDDPTTLMYQIIVQQEGEIQAINNEKEILKKENVNLTVSRDAWRTSSNRYEEALDLSRKETRAVEIQRDALKRVAVFDKIKWGIIGFGAGYVTGKVR